MDEAKIAAAVDARIAHHEALALVLETNDPEGAEKVNQIAGAWLEAVHELSITEYALYEELSQKRWAERAK